MPNIIAREPKGKGTAWGAPKCYHPLHWPPFPGAPSIFRVTPQSVEEMNEEYFLNEGRDEGDSADGDRFKEPKDYGAEAETVPCDICKVLSSNYPPKIVSRCPVCHGRGVVARGE